jgi:hypothetical protein
MRKIDDREAHMADITRTGTATGARTDNRPDSDVRDRNTARIEEHRQDETKPSFMTTEFWAMVAGIVALIVVYNVAEDPSLDLFRVCLLCTLAGMAYVVSRGLAKAGAARRLDREPRYR